MTDSGLIEQNLEIIRHKNVPVKIIFSKCHLSWIFLVEEMLRSVILMTDPSFYIKNDICFIEINREKANLNSH